MCKLLADLTHTNKTLLKEIITRFESRAAHPGIDIRLTSEIFSTAHMKTRALGLDPHDTTGRELYVALKNMAALHDEFIMKKLHINHTESTLEILGKLEKVTSKLNIPKQSQQIKPAMLKDIITQNPPKRLMKMLGYRTVDSLVKRETPGAILGAAQLLESKSWLLKLQAAYKRLQPYDMTTGSIQIARTNAKKWHKVTRYITYTHQIPLITVPEVGEVVILPVDTKNRSGFTLYMLSMIIHSVKEIRMLSSFLKYQQLSPQFGKLLSDSIFYEETLHVPVVGQEIHWRSFQRQYARDQIRLMMHPHIQAEDFAYRSAEETLYKLEPALSFWEHLDFVGLMTKGGPISMNLLDNLLNLVNNTPYEKRYTSHVRQATWDELFARYLQTDHIHGHAVRTLEPQYDRQPIFDDFEFAL